MYSYLLWSSNEVRIHSILQFDEDADKIQFSHHLKQHSREVLDTILSLQMQTIASGLACACPLMIGSEVVGRVNCLTHLERSTSSSELLFDEITGRIPKARLVFDNLRLL